MLDHLDDLDADFLAIYGIDLRDPDANLDAPMFFARAFRCWNYRGSMREELLAEKERQRNGGSPPPSASASYTSPSGRPDPDTAAALAAGGVTDAQGTTWVSPEQMRNLFPDMT